MRGSGSIEPGNRDPEPQERGTGNFLGKDPSQSSVQLSLHITTQPLDASIQTAIGEADRDANPPGLSGVRNLWLAEVTQTTDGLLMTLLSTFMKRFLTLVVLLVFVLSPLQSHAQAQAPAAAAKHSLWEARSGDKTIHLLGSVHFLREDSYPLAPVIENAFRNAQSVAFETDIAALQDPATALKMISVATCPEGKQLSDLIDPKLYKQLGLVMEDHGIPIETVAGFRPWFAAMTLSLFELQKMGFKPEHGVDQHFFTLAKAAGKKLVALETVETQTDLFGSMSTTEETQLLQQTLDDAKRMRQMFKDLVAAWSSGNSGALDKLLNEAMKEAPQVYNRLLLQRNKAWIPKIDGLLQSGQRAIVIVGAGHLVGKGSVIDLLQTKGYSVKQL